MRELLTISINSELKKSIEDAAKMYNVSKSEIVRKEVSQDMKGLAGMKQQIL